MPIQEIFLEVKMTLQESIVAGAKNLILQWEAENTPSSLKLVKALKEYHPELQEDTLELSDDFLILARKRGVRRTKLEILSFYTRQIYFKKMGFYR